MRYLTIVAVIIFSVVFGLSVTRGAECGCSKTGVCECGPACTCTVQVAQLFQRRGILRQSSCVNGQCATVPAAVVASPSTPLSPATTTAASKTTAAVTVTAGASGACASASTRRLPSIRGLLRRLFHRRR